MLKNPYFRIATVIIALLIITNPTLSAFKDFIGSDAGERLSRTQNFFVCSTYVYGHKNYLGMIGNFFYLHPTRRISKIDSTRVDSSTTSSMSSVQAKDDGGIDAFGTDTARSINPQQR